MTKVIMNGCNGKMGQCITEICKDDPEIEIVAGIDVNTINIANATASIRFKKLLVLFFNSGDILILAIYYFLPLFYSI